MKKIIQILSFLMISAFAFGQSVTILPSQTTNQSNTGGENINVTANSNSLGIYGRRFNGTFASKTPVLNGNELFRVSSGGWWGSGTLDESQNAAIKFNATENWGTGSGSKISFTTTPNGSISQIERMVINHNGKVGIGNTSPTGKVHINHLASTTEPHLHLQSTGTSSAIIKATTTNAGEWENHFLTNASAASNLVYWTNSINSTTPLILTGEGDALIERNVTVGGFTSLGTAAPKIKMKTLTNTTAGAEGGNSSFPHGLTVAKIIDYVVMVDVGGSVFVKSNHTFFAERQFDTEINGTNVRVYNHATNSGDILTKPIKVVITYTE